MATHKTGDHISCPWCGHTNSGATNAEGDEAPTEGSLTVCIECYGVGEFFLMKDGRLNIKAVNLQDLDPGDRAAITIARRRLVEAKRI